MTIKTVTTVLLAGIVALILSFDAHGQDLGDLNCDGVVDLATRSMWEGRAFPFDPDTLTAVAGGSKRAR